MSLAILSAATAVFSTACGPMDAEPESSEGSSGGSSDDDESTRLRPNKDSDGGAPAASEDDPGPSGPTTPTQAEFCASGQVELPMKGKRTCAGDLPGKFFRFAACSCTDLALSGSVRTSSMKSSALTTNPDGASIAANHFISFTGSGIVGGSAYAAGKSSSVSTVTYTGNMTVDHDLWSAGNVGVGSYGPPSVVNGNAYVRGSILPAGTLAVKGKTSDPGPFADPCDCRTKIDIPNIVAAFKTKNDNASIGLKPDALKGGGNLTLPCGRYYLTSIENAATINVQGTVALFIEKDVNVHGALKIVAAKGAQIDIFVAGSFGLTGNAQFGSLDAPAKVRLYVAKDLGMTATATIGGNIYAPNTTIGLTTQLKMAGSIFAQNMAFTGGFDITYDEDVLNGRGACSKPGDECSSCGECSGATPACKDGACVACETSADCCAPLVCSKGRCIQDLK